MSALTKGWTGVLAPLKDPDVFVTVDKHHPEWNNQEIMFDPDELYAEAVPGDLRDKKVAAASVDFKDNLSETYLDKK